MDLKAAYLVLQPLPDWQIGTVPHAAPPPSSESELLTYSQYGHLKSGSLCTSTPVQCPTPALAEVASALCRWPATPATGSLTVLPLVQFDLPAYLGHERQEINAWRRALIRTVFQSSYEYLDRYFFSLLYLEPKAPLLWTAMTPKELEEATRRIRTFLKNTDSAAVPQRYRDLFVSHGSGLLPPTWDLIAIRRSPLEQTASPRHALPASVLQLTEAITLIHRLRSGKKKIDSHSLLREEPSAYVTKLLGVSPEQSPRLHWLTDSKAATAYGHHMAARLQGIGSKDSARALADAFRSVVTEFDANATQNDDDWVWLTETFTNNPYRYGIVSSLRADLQEAGETIVNSADELAVRDQAISDYFTDYLNAAIARSNMLLQRRVLWLTILAVLLAILSLVQSWPVA